MCRVGNELFAEFQLALQARHQVVGRQRQRHDLVGHIVKDKGAGCGFAPVAKLFGEATDRPQDAPDNQHDDQPAKRNHGGKRQDGAQRRISCELVADHHPLGNLNSAVRPNQCIGAPLFTLGHEVHIAGVVGPWRMEGRNGRKRRSEEVPDCDHERILGVQLHPVGTVRADRIVGVADVQRDLAKLSVKRLVDLAAADQIGADGTDGAKDGDQREQRDQQLGAQ